ncbi:Na+/H+ antiporter subunit E [Devosia sp. WQ 349]|uniref:Na+/H+ antiporter subunit E n=1 Tax=Devosia sp. WQ 349K1 TaxID=2800329 RepID=UPI0019073256|nr:Na+/H+ antiporter subunit E [Devosia sp. WQ 349K1]MBK1793828.1 Na+/H+ antiporter subunit E [Devosia sp. WQ 349K1]
MSRLFPYPVLSLMLLLLWLTLQQSAGLGHIIMGIAIAIAVPHFALPVLPDRVRIKRVLPLVKMTFVAGLDIIRSNLAVFTILIQRRPKPTAEFIEMELQLTNEFALAILACIVTATPGSAWLQYDKERNVVLLHVFDLIDPDEWINTVRNRYEKPLLEVFQ